MVVLDRELGVIVWNHKAEDLWGMRSEEVEGRNFLNLDIGLPVEQLKGCFMDILDGGDDYSNTVVEARDRRGKDILCKVTCSPLIMNEKTVDGIIALMEATDQEGNPV